MDNDTNDTNDTSPRPIVLGSRRGISELGLRPPPTVTILTCNPADAP